MGSPSILSNRIVDGYSSRDVIRPKRERRHCASATKVVQVEEAALKDLKEWSQVECTCSHDLRALDRLGAYINWPPFNDRVARME